MAIVSGVYEKYLGALGKAQINMQAVTMRAYLIDEASFTRDLITHEFVADIAAGARIHNWTLQNPTWSNNAILDADDQTITIPANAATGEGILLAVDGANDTSRRLMAILGSDYISQLPTPTSSNSFTLQLTWSTSGILKL